MPESSRDMTTHRDNNISGPDFFGLYKAEIDDLLSQDDGLVSHFSGDEVGRKKGSIEKLSQTKESSVSGLAPLFSDGIGDRLSDVKKERLHSLLRQSVSTLTQEVDEV